MPTPLTIGTARALLTPATAITYPFGWFRFTTAIVAASFGTPYTEAGVPGSLVVTGNTLATSGGALQLNGVGSWGSTGLRTNASLARLAGRAIVGEFTLAAGKDVILAWGDGAGASYTNIVDRLGFYFQGTQVAKVMDASAGGANFGAWAVSTTYQAAIVLRGTGAHYLIKGGAYTEWTLLYVDNAGTTAALYPTLVVYSGSSGPFDNWRVSDIPAPWNTDNGIATSYTATTANGTTATMTADALVYHTITAQTGVTQELHFRKTDASNYWLLRMAAPGTNTIKVIEVVAGVETERASTAQTFTNAVTYRIGVIAAGAVIAPYVDNVAKTGYGSAATGLSATGVYVSHAGVRLEVWPRTVSLPAGV